MKDGKFVVLEQFNTHATSSQQGQKRKEVRGTPPPVQPSKSHKPSTRILEKKQKVKPSKPSANQPKDKPLPEVKDWDATLKMIDKDYFSAVSNAKDVRVTEEDVEAGIPSVPSKVGEVPREGDGETPKTIVVGDTRGEGGKPATVSKNAVEENFAQAAGGVEEKKRMNFAAQQTAP